MDEYVFIAINAGKVVGRPCYSLEILCKNLGISKLSKKDLPVISGGFSIDKYLIDKRAF